MATVDNRLPTEGTQIDIETRLAAIETALASLMADTTGQSIASAISGLGATLGSDRALIDGSNIGDKATFRNNIGLNIENYTIPINYANQSGSMILLKMGNLVILKCSFGNDTTFTSATGNDTICNLPSDFRPMSTIYGTCLFRDSGGWASANYRIGALHVQYTGDVSLKGKASEIQSCKYLVFSIAYFV